MICGAACRGIKRAEDFNLHTQAYTHSSNRINPPSNQRPLLSHTDGPRLELIFRSSTNSSTPVIAVRALHSQ
jgi:hypothetical protein